MKKKNKINKYQMGGYNFNSDYIKSRYQNITSNLLQPISPAMSAQVPQKLSGDPIQIQPYNPSTSPNIMGVAGNMIGGAGDMLTLVGGNSNATTGGEAAKESVQSVFKGAATGAKMGAALGPVGAVVGGIGGAVVGSIGKSGKVQVNGFYEDPTLTLGTGFKGAVQNKGLREKYRREKERVLGNRFALQNSALLNADWNETYDQSVDTMAYGGTTSSLAYVDDGELINTPDGNILEVPEEGKPTDSNLVNIPEGSRILSDTLKVPGSKETFAQMGKRMMSKKKSKGKDKYAENSAKLNQMNDQMIHDQLFNLQESMKGSNKQSKNKFRNGGKLAQGLTDLAALTPVLSNLGTTAESFDTVYNPYSSQILSTMAGRKYDITPARRAIRENRAISNYNASQSNTNTGASMAYRLQSQVAADKAIADLYSQKSNIENQYKGEYANTLNNLGQQFVSARNMSTDLNARSRAAARNINREALSQISNYAQNRRLMNNQRSRDMAMLDAYAPFLESVYTTADYSNLMNKFRR